MEEITLMLLEAAVMIPLSILIFIRDAIDHPSPDEKQDKQL